MVTDLCGVSPLLYPNARTSAVDIKRFLTKPPQSEIKKGFTVIPKAQVSCSGFEDNPLRVGVKLAHKGA